MKTYTGGCHCGQVRFEATMDLENSTIIECNCSHCAIKGLLLNFIPATQFTLLSGDKALTEYKFNKHRIQHLFCSNCGTQPIGKGNSPDGTEMVAVNIRCLNDVDFKSLTLTPYDGKSM